MALSLLYLLLLCIGTKCTHLVLCRKILMMFIYGAYYYNARVHIGIYKKKMENVKSSANPLFLILFFINLRNNILHEYKYLGRYFGLYKKKINDKKYEAI